MSQNNFSSRVRLKEFDKNEGYNRNAGKFKVTLWYFIKIIFFITSFPFPSSFKAWLLRCFGAKIGKGLVLKPRVNIHMPWNLEIGDDVWIGEESFILNFEKLKVGSNVCISQRAFLCGGNHNYLLPNMPYRNGPITLNDGCWIGASCFIGPNVIVGVDSIITAGSTVTKSIEANGIYSGNPAIFLKKRWND